METLSGLAWRLPVTELSQAGEARRFAFSVAASLGFNSTQQGRAGIVASELASNLAKHARDGELIVQELESETQRGLELIAIDSGPGIADLGRVMADGYSTAGSPGTGLGAAQRLSETFDVFSLPECGTVFVSRLWAGEALRRNNCFDVGAVSVPYAGEEANGDSWWVQEMHGGRCAILVVDGLGHGQLAAQAAQAAVDAFRQSLGRDLETIIEYAHEALRSTRGAALAIALIDTEQQMVDYAGIGNIAGAVLSDSAVRRLLSLNGTVGHRIRKIQKFRYLWSKESVLVMHSDGLTANWNLERYAGLLRRHPSVVAGVLYRDFRRKNDDATVLVARECEPSLKQLL